jgi:SHAQKYF class myb-like DNA-binding protein
LIGKYQKETEMRAKVGNSLKQGRWSKDEHLRFLEALKLFGKEWRKVQQHVCTRTSTQARSHAQKFFVKIEKKSMDLHEYLDGLDFNNMLAKDIIFSDLDDDDE